jgi:hypothetical protein
MGYVCVFGMERVQNVNGVIIEVVVIIKFF